MIKHIIKPFFLQYEKTPNMMSILMGWVGASLGILVVRAFTGNGNIVGFFSILTPILISQIVIFTLYGFSIIDKSNKDEFTIVFTPLIFLSGIYSVAINNPISIINGIIVGLSFSIFIAIVIAIREKDYKAFLILMTLLIPQSTVIWAAGALTFNPLLALFLGLIFGFFFFILGLSMIEIILDRGVDDFTLNYVKNNIIEEIILRNLDDKEFIFYSLLAVFSVIAVSILSSLYNDTITQKIISIINYDITFGFKKLPPNHLLIGAMGGIGASAAFSLICVFFTSPEKKGYWMPHYYSLLGALTYVTHNYKRSVKYYEIVVDVHTHHNQRDEEELIPYLIRIATCYKFLNQFAEAGEYYERAYYYREAGKCYLEASWMKE